MFSKLKTSKKQQEKRIKDYIIEKDYEVIQELPDVQVRENTKNEEITNTEEINLLICNEQPYACSFVRTEVDSGAKNKIQLTSGTEKVEKNKTFENKDYFDAVSRRMSSTLGSVDMTPLIEFDYKISSSFLFQDITPRLQDIEGDESKKENYVGLCSTDEMNKFITERNLKEFDILMFLSVYFEADFPDVFFDRLLANKQFMTALKNSVSEESIRLFKMMYNL